MGFKLSRIAAKFVKGIWNIHQFGYDEDGKFVKKVDRYKDYFYKNYLTQFTTNQLPTVEEDAAVFDLQTGKEDKAQKFLDNNPGN